MTALQRGDRRLRGLCLVVEGVLEAILFDVEVGVGYVITDRTVTGWEAVKRAGSLATPAYDHVT